MGRIRECFDENWLFRKGDMKIPYAIKAGRTGMPTDIPDTMNGAWLAIAYDDGPASNYSFEDWEMVELPHDWAVFQEYDRESWFMGGYLNPGVACYRKTFSIPAEYEGKCISLEFDGVSRNATLWVNGFLMGSHFSGYTPFAYDISDVLRYGEEGENVVFLKVDATQPEGWWYEGAGIYRHVWLNVTERLHMARHGVFVTTREFLSDCAVIQVETTVENETACDSEFDIITNIYNKERESVASSFSAAFCQSDGRIVVSQTLSVMAPNLWDIESPYLYTAEVSILKNGHQMDSMEIPFGIRTIAFEKDGFYLNGKKRILKGTCNHQDFGGLGVALPDSIHEYKILRLKEMGSNAYRCSHNPPAPELLSACDRLGMLVLDENRKLDSSPVGMENLTSLILRDRNHPSVILWCLDNEEVLLGEKSAKRVEDHMRRIVKKLDPTRLTTVAMNHGWNDNDYESCMDIVGYNYGQRQDQYFIDARNYPDRLMLCTETTSSTTTRGIYETDQEKGYCSSYETTLGSWCCEAKKSWQDVLREPRLTGMFAWTGFDYRGEPTPYEWPCINSHFGIMDVCGIPKDTYYYYQAVWKEEPVVHLFPHWNHKAGESIKVRIFTNCDSVELILNGRSLGEYPIHDKTDYFDQMVVFEPGTLAAVGKNKGQEVVRKEVRTAGEPAKILLNPHKNVIIGDGKDAVVVHVCIADENNTVVPCASQEVTFTCLKGGRILGVANGDPSSHEPDKAEKRKAFNGWCAVILQADATTEELILKAEAQGLRTGNLILPKQ